ncbi:S1 RNA-binding domain-containing protein [Actinoplanes sp. NPDC026623]|jgi:ribosomal protein S1|uniref:S1 RNA-binding domain-containing protein n=1 Tax=Actinoplanes sp. NPDC026623 TaxID=3155610 RepID=UPI0033CF05EE
MLGGRSENPELWAFLQSLHPGEILSGTVTAIERFGVFVALDDGPDHPIFPGVGFITLPELSWRTGGEPADDVVRVGQRISAEFLQFDTHNLEARLSLRAMWPDPFQAFADRTAVGQELHGRVTALISFGVFVEVADGIEGLLHRQELTSTPAERPPDVDRTDGPAHHHKHTPTPTQEPPDVDKTDGPAHHHKHTPTPTQEPPDIDKTDGPAHHHELTPAPTAGPPDGFQVGDEVAVVVLDVDRERRRLSLTLPA